MEGADQYGIEEHAAGNIARLFRGEDSNGQIFHANLKVFDSRLAILSAKDDPGLRPGDEVSNAEVVFGNSRLEFPLATVISVQSEEMQTYVSLRIPGGWGVEEKTGTSDASFRCRHSDTGSKDRATIPGELRLAAFDLAEVFQEIKDDVDLFESSLLQYSPEDRIPVEDEFTHRTKREFAEHLTEAVRKFEGCSRKGLRSWAEGALQRVLEEDSLSSRSGISFHVEDRGTSDRCAW